MEAGEISTLAQGIRKADDRSGQLQATLYARLGWQAAGEAAAVKT